MNPHIFTQSSPSNARPHQTLYRAGYTKSRIIHCSMGKAEQIIELRNTALERVRKKELTHDDVWKYCERSYDENWYGERWYGERWYGKCWYGER